MESRMKYSFLVPYHKRESLDKMFESFLKFYPSRTDYEVILAESLGTQNDALAHNNFIDIIYKYNKRISIKLVKNTDKGFSCSVGYNLAFNNSCGDYIIITNPETPHTVDVLAGFDELFEQDKDYYIVCACLSIFPDGGVHGWYQHSVHNNRFLHFCSSMSRANWIRTGGFDEDYRHGVAYEDNDFLERVKSIKIPIVVCDDLVVHHLEHPRSYLSKELIDINKKLFESKWKI